MVLTPTIGANYGFVELNRTFYELSSSIAENDDMDIGLTHGFGDHLRWPDLIKEYRVVLLSEAGSGKSAEILNIAKALRDERKPAFFLRLEHIPGHFEDAFEVGTYNDFEKWLASSEDGWLLLDSVDEARLKNPGDFELSIRILSRQIRKAKDRAHILITGRTTAWRPRSDLAHCVSHLPYAGTATSEYAPQGEEISCNECLQTRTETQYNSQAHFKIVALDDLTPDQVEVFAKARGIDDSRAFLNAVDRADAWSFTSRPQDLEELTEFWIDKGKIGSRLELMRNSIDRRLSERDQNRAHFSPLTSERARQGARLIAAAATLTQKQAIRLPDGERNPNSISVRSVLTDWDDKEQSTLLTRPIFDEEIYGSVRFHHRSVREYLTAEWFADLLKRETSRRTIEGLFFCNQYGLDIVVPTLRPILPWLSIMDDKIRQRVLIFAPEIILEGGDPSQLPLEVRRYILREVCEKMVDGDPRSPARDYSSVQRFSNPDLTDEIRDLMHQYSDNANLTRFLLRMVWLGQLEGALSEVMGVALNPSVEQYTRLASFKAINAIGHSKDLELVRERFLAESAELDRDLLTELLESIEPSENSIIWLLECLKKSKPKEPYTVDHLLDGVDKFATRLDMYLLPQLIAGLKKLLDLPPFIDRRFCKISKYFEWLMVPACKAVESLILARHPSTLAANALAILQSFNTLRDYTGKELYEIKAKFSELVPAWKELNRALFWFEINKSREENKEERVTDFTRIAIFNPLWHFDDSDFIFFSEQILKQTLLDNKLVALTLAFHLYQSYKRPRPWRERLKKLVVGNKELSQKLKTLFNPPLQDRESLRRWKRQRKEWKKREEANKRKRDKYHSEWKQYLDENMENIRASCLKNPSAVTNSMYYLLDQARGMRRTSSRWSEYNWKSLIPYYGEKIARLYRDCTVSFWRQHKPKLRSEGAPHNQTSYGVLIGLTGLEIEYVENIDWPQSLKATEVELACRYASFELNGFPRWLPDLFEAHPKIVCDFLIKELQYELSIEKPEKDTHYIISDLSWSGQWACDKIAPRILDILRAKEPKNLRNLDHLLKILQRSTIPDDRIEKLASRKCRYLRKRGHLARWLAVLTGVSPAKAINTLKARIEKIAETDKQILFAMIFVTHLFEGHRDDGIFVRQTFQTPEYLKSLYLLMQKYIRQEDDIHRAGTGAYSPGLRDNAQEDRSRLLELLIRIPGKESYLALIEIAQMHPVTGARQWIYHHAKSKAEQEGDIKPWLPDQVKDFNDRLERTPKNHRELAELANLRLRDLKDDFEHGDSSIADILRTVTHETEIRKYIGRELREKALGRYSIPQEEEFADAKKPDLRFHGNSFDGPVPVELKLADNWTGPDLFERLENQLCGDYLRDNRSNRGFFVLVYRGEKVNWNPPGQEKRMDFSKLVSALQNHWFKISPEYSNVDDITVIGIDLTKRSK